VQQRVAGPVGGGAGALRQPLAPVHGVAAKRPLIDMAVLGARERHAVMFELDDGQDSVIRVDRRKRVPNWTLREWRKARLHMPHISWTVLNARVE